MADPNSNDNPVVSGGATPLNLGQTEPGFDRFSPIIDVKSFKEQYLFGIPLKAAMTGEELSDETIKAFIRKGIAEFETSVRVPVNPVYINDRFDFERADDVGFGTRRMTRWPVLRVDKLQALWPGRNDVLAEFGDQYSQVVDYPVSWVSLQGDSGLVRIVPNSGSIINSDTAFVSSSAYRTIVLGGLKSWPNMWRITYWAGMDFDKIPAVVNDLIGIFAALKLISMIAPAIFPISTQAVGIDGLSQSTGTAGPQWLALRLQELGLERDRLVLQLKNYYGTDVYFAAF